MKHKVLLLDWDGVLYRGKYFSEIYSDKFGIDKEKILKFLDGPKVATNTNDADLKDLLAGVLTDWNWPGTVDELLNYWLKSDCELEKDTIFFIKESKNLGFRVYFATDQERYKTDYIWNSIGVKNYFDGKFISCEVGFLKNDQRFFEYVINTLEVEPKEILYFDDSMSKVSAALKSGIDARLFTNFESMKLTVLK